MVRTDVLSYLAFASQIFLLSYYLPNRLLARMRHILDSYPPATHPKLYPRPVEHYLRARWSFRLLTRLILLVGVGILLALVFWVDHGSFADDGYVSEAWPAFYGMLQFLPLMALELSEYGHLRQMRAANRSSKRVAELRRRGLTDLVSPALVASTAGVLAGAILVDLAVHGFVVDLGHDTTQRALVLIATNLLLAVTGFWTLRAAKGDPYQTAAARRRRAAVSVRSLFYVSMALSVFIAITAAGDLYALDGLDAFVLSLYFQAIALLSLGYTIRKLRQEDVDFDVYRSDGAPV